MRKVLARLEYSERIYQPLTENIILLLYPLTTIPLLVFTGLLILTVVLYFASKRK